MAKTVEDYKWKRKPGKGRPVIYPWETWIDGETWVASQGEDFKCELTSFQAYLYAKAAKEGCRVQTTITGKDVIFQFYDTNGKG